MNIAAKLAGIVRELIRIYNAPPAIVEEPWHPESREQLLWKPVLDAMTEEQRKQWLEGVKSKLVQED